MRLTVLALSLAIVALSASAQQSAAPAATAPITTSGADLAPDVVQPPQPLQPFLATYQVFHDGRELGTATMQVVHEGGTHWRIDLSLKGSGLLRLAGLNLQQSTVFDSPDGLQYRPLSQALVKRTFLSSKHTVGVYDWNARSARWTGAVKASRSAPVPLQDGDLSGLLIDLAVIRDAAPGKQLQYRFVDDGRARDHVYQVAPQTEPMQVGDLSYDAMRVDRVQAAGDNDQTIFWVASGVPTPVRILQREDGQDSTDLRLIQYQGS